MTDGQTIPVLHRSTFTDLKEERQAVLKSVLELNQMPAGMELFPASDDSAWQLISDVIDGSVYQPDEFRRHQTTPDLNLTPFVAGQGRSDGENARRTSAALERGRHGYPDGRLAPRTAAGRLATIVEVAQSELGLPLAMRGEWGQSAKVVSRSRLKIEFETRAGRVANGETVSPWLRPGTSLSCRRQVREL